MACRQAIAIGGLLALVLVLLTQAWTLPGAHSQTATPTALPSPRPDLPALTLVKDAVPNDPQDFTFVVGFCPPPDQMRDCVVYEGVPLDDDNDPSLSNSITFSVIDYEVTVGEIPVEGWTVSAINCDAAGEVDVIHGFVRLKGLPHEQFSCTFKNERSPATPTSIPEPTPSTEPTSSPIEMSPASSPATSAVLPAALPQTGSASEGVMMFPAWLLLAAAAGSMAGVAGATGFVISRFARRSRTR